MTSHHTRPLAVRPLLSQLSSAAIAGPIASQNISGDAGNNILKGTNSADTFDISQGGADTVTGKDGADVINAGAAFGITDKIDGGAGSDILNLNGQYNIVLPVSLTSIEKINLNGNHFYGLTTRDANVAAGTTLTVDASNGPSALHFDGSAETDGVLNITGSTGNDFILGGAGADTINLYNGGNDIAFGGAGDDIFVFSPSSINNSDFIDGGTDDNSTTHRDMVVLFGDTSAGITFGPVLLNNIELIYLSSSPHNVQFPNAFNHNITLSDDNALAGTPFTVFASDLKVDESAVINGSAETDDYIWLIGGAGNDTLTLGKIGLANGGLGNDTLIAATNDFTSTGFDFDGVEYYDRTNGGVGVTVDLTKVGVAQNTIGAGRDTITGFGNLAGSQYNDTLTGDDHNNLLNGNGGNDTLSGGVGDDFLSINGGITIAKGGAGSADTAAFQGLVNVSGHGFVETLTDGVTISLLLQGQAQSFTDGSVTLTGIENLSGTKYDDTLTGDTNDNVLSGGGGNDTLSGGSGNDTLNGDGAYDTRTATFDEPTAFVNTFAGNDVIDGGTGNDIIDFGSGTDIVTGGIGNDTINARDGLSASDSIDGGTGTDMVNLDGDYSAGLTFGATTMVNVEFLNLAAGNTYALTSADQTVASSATLTVDGTALGVGDVMSFDGSAETNGTLKLFGGADGDTLKGGTKGDTLTGAGGDDILFGNGAADALTGGGGRDLMYGGAAGDTFIFAGASDSTGANFDTIGDFDFAADKLNVGFHPAAVNARVTTGTLNDASFNTDLAGVIDASKLTANQAVLFTANGGDEMGHTFLIVDMNGTAGYQAGADLVVFMAGAAHLASFGASTFV